MLTLCHCHVMREEPDVDSEFDMSYWLKVCALQLFTRFTL